MKKNLLIAVTTWAALSVATVPSFAEGDAAAGKTKSVTCAACHGPDGNSSVPQWPKLAGQSASYIAKQLKDFKAKRRNDPSMSPQAQMLNEQDIEDLAAYFASQSPNPGSGNPALQMAGKKVYRKGNIKAFVIACVGCHGLTGKGNKALLDSVKAPSIVEAPFIASQHAMYVAKQIRAFRDGARTNDVGRIMRNITAKMTDEEIDAVAEYIAGLH
ncbi:cytochrome c4 cytochrome C, class I [Candidatus Thiomargarita nelsonii]|uniref:Cytochrome c4 cytochrome C, class I n=1 Tax=Candidatus Thiomargarita nelsonii TaxID=1003181 RepID=A0A176S4W0_9GAMM|nr:cytochrome c4 cytochrome C, class I [Candidatus Thiomargarita nelsonii]